jgi:alpha-tubulin suppressor-like RCC1 family protein
MISKEKTAYHDRVRWIRAAAVAVATGMILGSCGGDGGKKKGEEEPAIDDCASPIETSSAVVAPAIAVGTRHSLALRADRTVCAWGENSLGQLGDGSGMDRDLPVKIDGLSRIVVLSSGHHHGIALKDDGTVWTWGSNSHGQLGDGTTQDQFSPVQVAGLAGMIAVAAGESHSIALKEDGSVWAWGAGDVGQLGNGGFEDSVVPVSVGNLAGVPGIASGANHAFALEVDSDVCTWGFNADGQLGHGVRSSLPQLGIPSPVKIAGFSDLSAVSGGSFHSLAVTNDGTVYAWGDNTHGQLGNGTSGAVDDVLVPTVVPGLADVVAVSAGFTHSVALDSAGMVWTWGRNFFGQLGDGTTENRLVPVNIGGLGEILRIAGGGSHTLVMASDGTVWAWGDDQSGQLGNKTATESSAVPVAVQNLVVDAVP